MAKLSKKTDIRQERLPLFLIPQPPKKWQTYLKKQKQKRWLENLMISLGIVFVLGLTISVFRLGWWLGQPLGQAQSTKMEAPRWSGREQLNLLLMIGREKTETDNRFLIGSLNSSEGTLKVLIFPPDLKIPDTKGTYTLLELLRLASVQNPPLGMDFLINSLEKYLAIPIDGYVVASFPTSNFQSPTSNLEEIIAQVHRELQSPLVFLKIPFLINSIKNNLSTNLTPGQIFRGVWETKKVRFDRLTFYDLPSNLGQTDQDSLVRSIFEDPQVLKERLKISVQNASETLGLAAQTARAIENIGGEIIEVKNSENRNQKSEILVYSAKKDSLTIKRLEDILGVPAEWVKVEEAQRADVEMIVTH